MFYKLIGYFININNSCLYLGSYYSRLIMKKGNRLTSTLIKGYLIFQVIQLDCLANILNFTSRKEGCVNFFHQSSNVNLTDVYWASTLCPACWYLSFSTMCSHLINWYVCACVYYLFTYLMCVYISSCIPQIYAYYICIF